MRFSVHTTTVTSTAAISSNRTVLPPWPSGVNSPRENLDDLRSASSRPIALTMPVSAAFDPSSDGRLSHLAQHPVASSSARLAVSLARSNEPAIVMK